MAHLFHALAQRVDAWRAENYPCPDYPAIREILEFAQEENSELRYLRRAQFRALETYWYLRLILNTPHITDLYAVLFPALGEQLQAMGVSPGLFAEANFDYPALVQRIGTDNTFVKQHGLESLRETIALDYPSYILALAMGAGKTILMGSIVATEFALALEYPDGPFVENALIFAPGKTILSALRELADVPYERLLPPRFHKPFAASLKLTRCLRQVPGNVHPARVYLTSSNRKTLEDQLAETYGTSLRELDHQQAERVEKEIRLHKPHLPPLLVRKRVLRFRKKTESTVSPAPTFVIPDVATPTGATIATYTIAESAGGDTRLQRLDAGDETLAANAPDRNAYAIALVKPEGFDVRIENDQPVYTARISFAKERAELYKTADDTTEPELALSASFHYEGYNFDSGPEAEFLDWTLGLRKANAHPIEGLWFTGGLTDPAKTELAAEYLGEDGRWHRYTPDFVIRRADGKHLVVEIKKDTESPNIVADLDRHARGEAAQTLEGRKAVALKRWEDLTPDRLAYHVMFADTALHNDGKRAVKDFILGCKTP